MKPKMFVYAFTIVATFFLLVYYNYQKAQLALKETRPSPLSVELVSYPESITKGGRGSFFWHVQSSPDLSTSFSTIYWGIESSPGALTKIDSPQAVGYPRFQSDFTNGRYILPNDFDLRISFDKLGRIFFRAYAKVGGDHLWSEERSFEVVK